MSVFCLSLGSETLRCLSQRAPCSSDFLSRVLRGWIEDGGEAGFKTWYDTVLWDCTAERIAFTLNHMLKLSDGPVNPFYGKKNSQYLSRLGGRAGGAALSVQYLFGPEWNNSFSRMLVFFSLCFLL